MRVDVTTNIDFGNECVFKDAFDRHYRSLCFYALRILGEDYLVDDLVQEVFLRTWERHLVFATVGSMKAYMYSSVHNACVNLKKSVGTHRRHHSIIMNEGKRAVDEESALMEDTLEAEVFSEIFGAIENLPYACRRVFELSYINGMSVEAVAAELGVSSNTVKTQRSRAKKILQESLKGLYSIMYILFML